MVLWWFLKKKKGLGHTYLLYLVATPMTFSFGHVCHLDILYGRSVQFCDISPGLRPFSWGLHALSLQQ